MEDFCFDTADLLNNYQNSYFDNFDNLVSHSRESALKNLKFWQDIDSNELIKKYEIILNEMQINKNAEPADIIRSEINKINSHN